MTDPNQTEIENLRALAACMYQFAGAHDAPEVWLDALSEASDGRPFSTENLLPYSPATEDQKREALAEVDRLAEAGLCQFTGSGKHAFLEDIRGVIAKLGIQGGLTSYKE